VPQAIPTPPAAVEPRSEAPEVAAAEPAAVPEAPVEGERPETSAPSTHEDYRRFDRGDRGDRGGRRDRDRRGKKPKIPSFENKSYESRPDDRTYATGPLAVLPGESLAKHSRHTEAESVPREDNSAPASAAEETPDSSPERSQSDQAVAETVAPTPREVKEAQAGSHESRETGSEPHEDEKDPKDERSSSSARITDRSDNYKFAHRTSNRRGRRGRGPAPAAKQEEHRPDGHSPRTGPTISELLREGQEILVQVSKEPLGKKGARITSHIALPGRYLVYMPTVDHVGVSRKIASDEERSRLKRIIHEHKNGLPGGFIVRTAAEGRGEEEFVQDIRFLGNLWSDIRAKSEKKSAPALMHRDLNLVERLLRDQLSQDYRAIRLDNEGEFATVLDFVNKFQPALVNRVKLHLKDTPIFEEYGLNSEIEKALRSKVWLKSGGYIVINQTEALVAIDVNTGKYVGKSNRLEDTIVRTNVDAVHEIVRQIRLRNLGGIIVVDFIDMEEKKNRQRVMAALEEAIRADRSPSKTLQFNDFGLVAITRKRTQPSLERTLCRPCPSCSGSGWAKSPETISYEIQQEVRKMSHLLEGKEITVRVNPEIAKALKSGEFISINELEDWTKKDIVVKSDPLLQPEHFDIF
jgi:ribonuclease G